MRIGELAKRTGLSRDTIRFYERHGLIESVPDAEPTNTYRDYPDGLVEQLAMIVEAREAGLSVADLTELTQHVARSHEEPFDAETFIDAKIAEVQGTIDRAQHFLAFLKATKSAFAEGPVEWRESD